VAGDVRRGQAVAGGGRRGRRRQAMVGGGRWGQAGADRGRRGQAH